MITERNQTIYDKIQNILEIWVVKGTSKDWIDSLKIGNEFKIFAAPTLPVNLNRTSNQKLIELHDKLIAIQTGTLTCLVYKDVALSLQNLMNQR